MGIEWAKKNPWYRSYRAAKNRCNPNSKYGAYHALGIKFLMTIQDFKFLWFRDKAYLMKKPSIDRIRSKENYELKNCRYIEWIDNCSQGGKNKGIWEGKYRKTIK